jgi:hypothetical protein
MELDKSGRKRPSPLFVKGPTGYWQLRSLAQVELMHGPQAQMSLAPIPSNTPNCSALCVTIASSQTFVTGSAVSESLSGVSDALINHPEQAVSAAGHVIKRYVLAAKVYNLAEQMENIKSQCQTLCNMDAAEYQYEFNN